MDCGGMLLDRYLLGSRKPFHSRCACAFSIRRWIGLDHLGQADSGSQNSVSHSGERRDRGETIFQESVEALGSRMDAMHDSVDALYESVDKLSRRVNYHSEWSQSLHEMIATQHRSQKTAFVEANDTKG